MAFIADPKSSLRAIDAYLRNIGELLIDAGGDARDAKLANVEAQIAGLAQAVTSVQTDVRALLAKTNWGGQ